MTHTITLTWENSGPSFTGRSSHSVLNKESCEKIRETITYLYGPSFARCFHITDKGVCPTYLSKEKLNRFNTTPIVKFDDSMSTFDFSKCKSKFDSMFNFFTIVTK